jgi:RNA polymerase sigma-70 factor (ECF subfamily)
VLAAADLDVNASAEPNSVHHELLIRYITAFERFDIDALVALVHEDITLSMPPHPFWLHGRDDFRRWMRKTADHCRDARLVAIGLNGSPAAAVYRQAGPGEPLEPSAIHVLERLGHRIAGIHAFLDPGLFPVLRLPSR